MSWDVVGACYGEAVERYHANRGTNAAVVQSTVRTNTELVPKRGQTLVDLVATTTTLDTVRNRRILELGCGFGALAAYLAWAHNPARVVGVDVREEFVAAAKTATASTGVELPLGFTVADMRDLRDLRESPFDLVIVNNALIYLTSGDDVDQALREIHDVLMPSGWVVIYHANRWRWREPFTKDPAVHLLPPAAARWVSRRTGWRHNHGRVRLLSAPELRRRAARAGLRDAHVVGFGTERRSAGVKRYFGGYYSLSARRR